MNTPLQDLRQATRSLLRTPGFTVVAVLTLGLGLGASTAIYSLIERVVLDPLPYPEADRLVRLHSETTEGEWSLSRAQYVQYREGSGTVEALAGYRFGQATIAQPDGAERVGVGAGTATFFRLLGARPALGRLVSDEDDEYRGAPPHVAVLSHGYWERVYGSDPAVLGRTLMIGESPAEIIGVMQPGFQLPARVAAEVRPDIWLPLQPNLSGEFWNSHMEFQVLARLAPGATAADASRELETFNPQLVERFPQAYSQSFIDRYGFRPRATPLKEALVGDVAGSLWILLAGVGLVLVIACANIANLFLVRAEGRRRELAVRVAMGAGRGAVLRHFLAESVAVTAAGAGLALLFASAATGWLRATAPVDLPRLDGPVLDGTVVLFTVGLSLLVALALSVLPTVRYGRLVRSPADLIEGGRTTTAGRERQRARAALVVTQVALALILLVGAALLLESFRRIRAVDPGIDARGVLAVQVPLSGARYGDRQAVWAFQRELLDRVRALPGVEAAGATQMLPFSGNFACTVQAFPDAEVMQRIADSNGTLCAGQGAVTDGYFEALGIPVLQGRTPTRADNEHPQAGAVVVSRAFADKFWPGEDPLGKQVAPGGRSQGPFYTVVGVVGDVYSASPTEPPAVAIYYPVVPIPSSGGFWGNSMTLTVRSAGVDPVALFPRIRDIALELDPGVPLANPRTMTSIVAASMSGLTFTMTLLGAAALAALLLAAVGLYGVLSYLVQRRTSEIGVRIALGARPRQVERMVVRGSFGLAALGLGIGVAGALGLTRFLAGMLYEVRPTQPAAYLAAASLLAGVALLASWIPARRAARVDPVEALRTE